MKKYFKNNLGFSLMEVVVAAGIASLVALVAYTTLRSSQTVVGNSLVSSEVAALKNQIIVNMGTPDVCEKNFVGKPVLDSTTITSLLKKERTTVAAGQDTFNWVPFIVVNNFYGSQKTLQVKTIRTSPSPANPRSMIIEVAYDVVASLKSSSKKSDTFTVEVFIAKDPTNTLVSSCVADIYTMIQNAIKFSCSGNGATYNAAGGTHGTCTHNNIKVVNEAGATVTTANGLCPAGEFLYQETTTAGTLAGATTNAGNTTYRCRKYTAFNDITGTQAPCPADHFVKSIKATDGTVECVSIDTLFLNNFSNGQVISTMPDGSYQAININCGSDYILRKVETNGTATCRPKYISGSCPVNQYIYGMNNDGTPMCAAYPAYAGSGCSAGYYLTAINADGSVPAGGCLAPVLPNSNNCNVDQYVISYLYGDGSGNCVLNN